MGRTREDALVLHAGVVPGAAFFAASLDETQQTFLELNVEAFEWFGGVFAEVRFDTRGSPVKKVLKGRRRNETGVDGGR